MPWNFTTKSGGICSPLLSNLYLTAVDRMLERAKEVTRRGPYTYLDRKGIFILRWPEIPVM